MLERILVIDDDEFSRAYLVLLLQASGFDPYEAANGEEGLRIASEMLPDLVLLDVVMPGMDGYVICETLKKDERFIDMPVIFLSSKSETEDKIRGLDVGAADYITKPFDEGEVLARVRSQLKIRKLTQEILAVNEQLQQKQHRLDEDLRAAGIIQRSMLPGEPQETDIASFAFKFIPSEQVGGDIFNIIPYHDHIAFYVLDVSGHGVPSALVAVSVNQLLAPQSEYCSAYNESLGRYEPLPHPCTVLENLDEQFPIERFERYFTMFYGVIASDGVFQYSAAAHPPSILLRKDGTIEELDKGGTLVGLGGAIPFEEDTLQLNPGDRIIVYTDGIIEHENEYGEFFGSERLFEIVKLLSDAPTQEIPDAIHDAMMAFGDNSKPVDDVSILAIEYTGNHTS